MRKAIGRKCRASLEHKVKGFGKFHKVAVVLLFESNGKWGGASHMPTGKEIPDEIKAVVSLVRY